jgi:hypothetical protein
MKNIMTLNLHENDLERAYPTTVHIGRHGTGLASRYHCFPFVIKIQLY